MSNKKLIFFNIYNYNYYYNVIAERFYYNTAHKKNNTIVFFIFSLFLVYF